MGHRHDHGAARGAGSFRRLAIVLALSLVYLVAEVIGGLLTNSLALLADAAHMFSDVAALGLSLFALWIARRPPAGGRTYGYLRAEILAALANGATLVAVSIYVIVEALHRLGEPPDVQGGLMLAIAIGGLVTNLIGLRLLDAGKSENLNVHGAWLHVMTDALGSLGTIVAAGLVWAFGWDRADPIASILIGLLVIASAWRLLQQSVSVLMEIAPAGLDVDAVRATMLKVPGVLAVHDLHVWTITSGLLALSAHVTVGLERPTGALLADLRAALHANFGIDHTTLQLEPEGFEGEGLPV